MSAHFSNAVRTEEDSADQSLDTAFNLLSHRRRRDVLACLADATQPIALADLAEDVAGRENEEPTAEVPREEVLDVYMSLYHRHVPKLVAAGAAVYDQDDDLVRESDAVDPVERVRTFVTGGGEERRGLDAL